jgi:glycosyltransferase involved in cell wall biosynthesis
VDNQPLVSIVVPSYNHADFVRGCLESVAAQSYRRLELCVIDDASRDGSVAAIENTLSAPGFRARFEGRIRFECSEANQGAHRTINRGVSLTNGEFVGILNSDDRYAPGRVERMMEVKQSQHASLAFSAVRMIDLTGRDITDEDWLSSCMSHSQRSVPAAPSVGFAALRSNVAVSTGNLLFRRSLFDAVGGFRPLKYCHDWDFLLRSVLLTEPLFVPEPLYEYRIHETNSFHSLRSVADHETKEVLRAYFSAIHSGKFENQLAPAPATWPKVFETFLGLYHLGRYWHQARQSPVD